MKNQNLDHLLIFIYIRFIQKYFQNAVLMSMDEIARKDAVIIVTTTKCVTPSLETVANVLMVIKMQNVIQVSV